MPHCSVALSKEGELLECLKHPEVNSHSGHLHGFIGQLFDSAGIKKSDLCSVVYSEGPGSYTGLRIGLSAAKGLAYGLDIPLIGLPTLKIIAWHMRAEIGDISEELNLFPAIDAGRNEVYMAVFDKRLHTVVDTQPLIVETNTLQSFSQGQFITVFLGGSGSAKCSSIWNSPELRDLGDLGTSATHMVELGWEGFQSSLFKDLAYCEPKYIKAYRPGKSKKSLE